MLFGWWLKSGSVRSCACGSATHVCMPCRRGPAGRCSSGLRSECAMPCPAVIQFTAPGSMRCTVPRLSRCMSAPSNRYVTVASPMCGCGRTSTPVPGGQPRRPHVIEEDERPDHLVRMAGQQAPDFEAAEVLVCGLRSVCMQALTC